MRKNKFNIIAILDDDGVNSFIIHTLIKRAPFYAGSVELYSEGWTLLNVLRTHSTQPEFLPELIFLDIHMPVMDGFQFLDQLKQLPVSVTQKVTIILMSSFSHDKRIETLLKEKIVMAFFQKPIGEEELKKIATMYQQPGLGSS